MAALALMEMVRLVATPAASPLAPGTILLGLGLAAAVCVGVMRNTTAGVLAWLVVAFIMPALVTTSIPAIDRLMFLALTAGWLITLASGRRSIRHVGAPELLMLVFLLYIVGSALAPHELPAGTVPDFTTLLLHSAVYPFALFVIVREAAGGERAVRAFMWTLTGIGGYLALTIIFQKTGLQGLVFPRQILDPALGIHPDRGRGPLLNSAADGAVLVPCFVAALHLGTQRDVPGRVVALILALIMPVGVFFTETRAIWLATAIVILMGVAFARGFRRWYLVLIGVAIAYLAVNWQTFLSDDRAAGGVTSSSEVNSRLNDIATHQWAIDQKPIFGWGIARYVNVNTEHHQHWDNLSWANGLGDIGHNTFLVTASELGLVGLGIWAALVLAVGLMTIRAWRVLPATGIASRRLVFAFWCAAAAWMSIAATIDMRLFAVVTALLFAWAGLVAAQLDRATDRPPPVRATVPVAPPGRRGAS